MYRCFHGLFNFCDCASQIAASDIAPYNLRSSNILAVYQIGPAGRGRKIGDVLQSKLPSSVGQLQPQFLQEIWVRPVRLLKLDHEVEAALSLQDFRHRLTLKRRLHEVSNK